MGGATSAEIFLKLLKAKREVPGAAERQKTLAAQDGKCALCGCGLTAGLRAGPRGAGEAGLCGQRADFAGAVRRLPQREDAEGERAAHELESRVAPPASWSTQVQTCQRRRCGRGALQAQRAGQPFPLPILCPADGVEPVDGVLPDLGFVEGCCDRAVHAPLVGEGLREVRARAVQLAAAAAHAVDHLRAARPQAYRRVHAELGHVLLALGPGGVHALQRAPQRRRVHGSARRCPTRCGPSGRRPSASPGEVVVGQLEKVVQHGADGVVLVAVPLVVREPQPQLLGWHVAAAPDSDVAGRSCDGVARRLLLRYVDRRACSAAGSSRAWAAALSECAQPSLDSTGWREAFLAKRAMHLGHLYWAWLPRSAPACRSSF